MNEERKPIFKHYDEHIIGTHQFDMGAEIALQLLLAHGLVAGFRGQEDSTGRASLDLLPVQETVDRAFAIGDLFMQRCQAENRIRQYGPLAGRELVLQNYDAWRIVPVKTQAQEDEARAERLRGRRSAGEEQPK